LIVVLRKDASPERIVEARDLLSKKGIDVRAVAWNNQTLLVTHQELAPEEVAELERNGITERVVNSTLRAQLASKEFQGKTSEVRVGDVSIGAMKLVIIAGPCSIESRTQFLETAHAAKRLGASLLRGGVYKPRTSPYDFQGLGDEGLPLLAEVREEVGLPIVTEVLAPEKVDLLSKYTDMLQIGARNMQNFSLLKAVGKSRIPVLLKRGMMATIDEWLQAAEYILLEGNPNVVLCERGIRTFEKATRNTLDLAAIPVLRKLTHLPVVVDPSHATGSRDLVTPMAKAAVAAGADGLMIETHPNPERAFSDSHQQLDLKEFGNLVEELEPVARAVGRLLR